MQLFLVDGLRGEQKAHLTKDCLRNLHQVEVKEVWFTCDRPATHQANNYVEVAWSTTVCRQLAGILSTSI